MPAITMARPAAAEHPSKGCFLAVQGFGERRPLSRIADAPVLKYRGAPREEEPGEKANQQTRCKHCPVSRPLSLSCRHGCVDHRDDSRVIDLVHSRNLKLTLKPQKQL